MQSEWLHMENTVGLPQLCSMFTWVCWSPFLVLYLMSRCQYPLTHLEYSLALPVWGLSYSTPLFFILFSCSAHENYSPHCTLLLRPACLALCTEFFPWNRTVSNPSARITSFLVVFLQFWCQVDCDGWGVERKVVLNRRTHILEKWLFCSFFFLGGRKPLSNGFQMGQEFIIMQRSLIAFLNSLPLS